MACTLPPPMCIPRSIHLIRKLPIMLRRILVFLTSYWFWTACSIMERKNNRTLARGLIRFRISLRSIFNIIYIEERSRYSVGSCLNFPMGEKQKEIKNHDVPYWINSILCLLYFCMFIELNLPACLFMRGSTGVFSAGCQTTPHILDM